MKLAILADVHSNKHALEATLREIDHLGADMIVCAGDIVGYGAFPNECCEIMRTRVAKVVKGNHDCAVLRRDPSGANPYAARAIMWTADMINPQSRKYLEGLDTEVRLPLGKKMLAMFHGSPTSVDEYVFEDDVNEELLASAEADTLVLGHTHVPCIRRLDRGLFLNPGSVGQPRDGEWRASFGFLDTEKNEPTIRRVHYDVISAAEAIRKSGLPGFLADRLFQGH